MDVKEVIGHYGNVIVSVSSNGTYLEKDGGQN